MLLFERWVPSPDLDGYVICQLVVIMSRKRMQCSLWALGHTSSMDGCLQGMSIEVSQPNLLAQSLHQY